MARSGRISRKPGHGFWREWRGELIALVVAAAGVFLLVEQFEIRATASRFLQSSLRWTLLELEALVARFPRIRPSDLVGLLLIAAAIVLVVRRIGFRMRISASWSAGACPKCGRSTLRRVHRRSADVAAWVLPVRRYACRDETCGWTGLRAKPLREHHRAASPPG